MTIPGLARIVAALLLALAGADVSAQSGLKALGDYTKGQLNLPVLPVGLYYVESAAGGSHSLARRNDGSVVASGYNLLDQCNVPPLPAGLTWVDIAASYTHSIALRSDGSAVAWGGNAQGECDVPPLPVGLSYVQVSAGTFSGARRSDGSIIC